MAKVSDERVQASQPVNAGDPGSVPVPAIDEDFTDRSRIIHTLRDSVHHTLNREFLSVTDDLEQLRGLLSDAANRLSVAFRDMTHASAEIESLMQARPEGEAPARLEDVVSAAARIAGNAGSTIQSLQFEDMATQLLAHVRRRLDLVEAFSKDMAALSLDTVKTPLHTEALVRLQNVLECYQIEMSEMRRKAIQQESLDAGAIELF